LSHCIQLHNSSTDCSCCLLACLLHAGILP
jgi:hypothetical protein